MDIDFGLVSADSHVTEPPDCYERFIDPAYRDRLPHVVVDERGGRRYLIPGLDQMAVPMGLIGSAGRQSSEIRYHARQADEWQRSGWDPTARIADQEADGVVAAILYPSIGVPLGVHPDLDYRHACNSVPPTACLQQRACNSAPATARSQGRQARARTRAKSVELVEALSSLFSLVEALSSLSLSLVEIRESAHMAATSHGAGEG